MLKMNSGVYLIRFGRNSAVYVGSSVDLSKRRKAHLSSLRRGLSPCVKLQMAFNKYTEDAFIFEVIELCGLSVLRLAEEKWIHLYDSVNKGFNVSYDTRCPMQGRKHSEATKKLMACKAAGNRSHTGRVFSSGHRLKISEANKGRAGSSLYGGDHPNSKLTEDETWGLRFMYSLGVYSQQYLGNIYGIAQQTVYKIVTHKLRDLREALYIQHQIDLIQNK